MNATALGITLLVWFALILGCVFLWVVCVVACFKIIQIAEDLRYIRSKSDIHVSRPMPMKKILLQCGIASLVIIILVITFFAGYTDNFNNLSKIFV